MSMFLMVVLMVMASVYWHQRARQARQAAKRRRPSMNRITDPKRQGGLISSVWQLQSNGCQCKHAQRLGGRRLAIEDTVSVLTEGLEARPCRCYYRPLRDERRGVRRDGSERRTTLRFDLVAQDRRLQAERRQGGQVWQQSARLA